MHKLRFLPLLFLALCFFPQPGAQAQAREGHIVILHTTDVHGRIVTDARTIGLDLVAGIAAQTPGALLVDSGDFLMGLAPAAMTNGKDVVAIMKKAGYFAAAIGNHEFDYGLDELMRRRAEADQPPAPMRLLSANVRGKDGKLLFEPEAGISMDGVKVCLFGLTTESAKFAVTPRHVRDISFDDAIATARTVAAKQRAAGCELVVVLSHIGSKRERFATSRELAQVPGIDLVIDGHSHVTLDEKNGDGALLVSAGAHNRNLGRVDITYDKKAKKITSMSSSLINREQAGRYAPAPAVAAEISAMTARLDKELSRPVGRLAHSQSGARQVLRAMEAPLGNLMADAVRAAYPCDFALLNGGGLREGLKKGELTVGDIVNVVPFRDQAVTVKVSGRELKEILEFGFSMLPELFGGFPQISGLIVRVNPANKPGERVLSLCLENGAPVDPDQEYALATSNYVASGGDGYPVLAAKELINAEKSVQQAAMEYIGAHNTEQYKSGPPQRIIIEK